MRKRGAEKSGTRKGIAKRLFLYIIFVVFVVLALVLLSNTLLLGPIYKNSVKAGMSEALREISKIDFTASPDVWTADVSDIAAGKDYSVVIRKENRVLYSSSIEFGLRSRPEDAPNPPPGDGGQDEKQQNQANRFFTRDINGLEEQEDGAFFGTITGWSGIELMVYTKTLDNGISVSVTQPVEPITKSIQQSNILLAGCTLIAVALSAVFAFAVSKRFTKPITQIKNTVGALAALDFGKKCDVRTGDELESLADDVNLLGGELKSALETLKAQNEKLKKDIIAQRQFISNASHELRTPLSIIKGYAEEINSGYARAAAGRKTYVKIIAEEAEKMSRLLKEMLELTRMESGTAHLQKEKLSAGEAIRGFLEKYDGFITENSLKITLKIDENDTGCFDAVRFEQVLANYISNAARYGDERKEVTITAEPAGDVIRVCVFNSGRHIPEEMMEHIWDGFFKADAARTRAEDSYGLGLSIVKAIQNAAGMRCGAKNVPGGVVFWFDVEKYKPG